MRVKSGLAKRKGLDKTLDGWQLGLAIVLGAWALVMLVVPRPALPLEIPEPQVTPRELATLRDGEAELAAEAQQGLSDVSRALGTVIRSLGRAEADHDLLAAGAARGQIAGALAAMPSDGLHAMLVLRAFQTATFVTAVRQWESTGAEGRDLRELGGSLVAAFRDAGWCIDDGERTKITMNDDVLGVAFRKRWNEIVGLRRGAGEITLTEEKILFRYAIAHSPSSNAPADPLAARALGARNLVRRIDAYARIDPTYPADLARGIAYFGGGSYGPAQLAFQRHLAAHPDGPLTLRARNFGRAALLADIEGFAP